MSIQVIKRKSGLRYRACVMVGGSPIKQTFLSRKDAVSWITTVKYRRDNKQEYFRSVSIKQMFDAYLDHCASNEFSLSTINGAKLNYKNYLFPVFGKLDMVAVTTEQHEDFLQSLPRHFKIKSSTINRIRYLIQGMFTVAIKKRLFGGVFKVNPYSFIESLDEHPPEIEYWEKDSVEKFLSYVRGDHYYPLFVLMLNTGMRISECVALDRAHIDTYSDTITVRRTWCSISEKAVDRTKGRRVRRIGIAENAVLKSTLYPILPSSGLVFKNERTGGRVSRDGMTKHIFPRLCREAEVPVIMLHSLRHTFASHYMMNGGNINDLSETLGHASVETTRKYYIHFSPGHIQKRGKVVQFGSVGDKVVNIRGVG